jgi:hypothetical protein
MTPRSTYAFAVGLFATLGAGVLAAVWATRAIGETGVHGPVGAIAAVPFLVIYFAGAVTLPVLALKSRLRPLPVLVSLLPIGCFVAGVFVFILVSATAA